jgi:hypothetical protein
MTNEWKYLAPHRLACWSGAFSGIQMILAKQSKDATPLIV